MHILKLLSNSVCLQPLGIGVCGRVFGYKLGYGFTYDVSAHACINFSEDTTCNAINFMCTTQWIVVI